MKKKSLLIYALVFVLLIGGAYMLYQKLGGEFGLDQLATEVPGNTVNPSEAPKPHAPDFTVIDKNGNSVTLSQFIGKPVILNFWSSRCGPCRVEMPDFDKKYQEFGDKVEFVMVNVTDGRWDTLDTAKAFLKDSGYSFPVYFDTNVSAARAYGVNALPTTYFIDAEGVLIARSSGAINIETLQRGIDMILP